jgi:uncharacterized membrane protein YhaH (DUF805 family)
METGLNNLFSWEILATSICIYSIILCIKKIAITYRPLLDSNKDFKIIMIFLNTFLGIIFAFVPDFLPGKTIQERCISGLVCGFMSNYTYYIIQYFINSLKKGNDNNKPKGDKEDGE